MASAAQIAAAPSGASWTVSRDGESVAVVAVRHEGGGVVVKADLAAAGAGWAGEHHFDTVQGAEEYVGDLIASFTYLGCDVSRS